MSAPLFLVDALPGTDRWVLDGPEGRHAATVQRLRIGETLLLADGRGGTASAEVTAVGRGTLTLLLTGRRQADPPDPRLVVVQGLAKGERGELAVQAMTEVAWTRSCRGRRPVRWCSGAASAATGPATGGWPPPGRRRSRPGAAGCPASPATRTAPPDRSRPWSGPRAGALVLHEQATERLAAAELPDAGDIVLVVGPEGGITDAEVAALSAAGARPVRLGDTVLRTSTAGVAALAVLNTRLARW